MLSSTNRRNKANIVALPKSGLRFRVVGIYRDHETLQPVEYYFKAPEDLADRLAALGYLDLR